MRDMLLVYVVENLDDVPCLVQDRHDRMDVDVPLVLVSQLLQHVNKYLDRDLHVIQRIMVKEDVSVVFMIERHLRCFLQVFVSTFLYGYDQTLATVDLPEEEKHVRVFGDCAAESMSMNSASSQLQKDVLVDTTL